MSVFVCVCVSVCLRGVRARLRDGVRDVTVRRCAVLVGWRWDGGGMVGRPTASQIGQLTPCRWIK